MVLPMFHIFGAAITFTVPRVLGTLLIVRDFNPGAVVRAFREEAVVFAALVPAMIHACLDQPEAALGFYSNLRAIVYGASSMPEITLRRAIDVFGCEFFHAYGMTEIAPITTLLPDAHRRALNGELHLLRSVGKPLAGIEVRVVNAQDEDVPSGTSGEVLARGNSLMLGYWNLPDASAGALRGGWMHTGDVGYLDDEGNLYLLDRLKDMIISGAENIYPREVEEVLSALPGVAECAVIGIPNARWGKRLRLLWLVLRARS
jgi:acyl-CoA synthetase (AMP-forming)/AMP-acid ligase II